jgi:hypothetical protein
MTKFATKPKGAAAVLERPTGAIKTKAQEPDTTTYEGGDGFTRKAKGELFLLAVTNMVGENTFYESGKDRDQRFVDLIHKVAAKDPNWVARFIPYLRDTLNMRTASIVMAAEYVKAGGPYGRSVVASALVRAEEPSVLIGYWKQFYGARPNGRGVRLPQPIKRGIADAILRLYNERSVIKYDSATLDPRFGDVIELVHPSATAEWQRDLFGYAIARRHNRERYNLAQLPLITKFRALMAMPVDERRALVNRVAEGDTEAQAALDGAGLTWENLSGWLQGPMDAKAWEAIIPQMGYMALLRNLRNFDEAKVSDEVADGIAKKLVDPDEVARSRQLPLRFLSAYKEAPSLRWSGPLEKAVNLSLVNVPALSGKTLIMIDDSGSMQGPLSARSKLGRNEAAALFGAALALRAENATLVAYATQGYDVVVPKGGSVLPLAQEVAKKTNGGTNTFDVLVAKYSGHDRIIIVTDEQAFAPASVTINSTLWPFTYQKRTTDVLANITAPIYTFNVAGLKAAHLPTGDDKPWYNFGGLTDQGFKAIELLEQGTSETWPF